MNQKLINVNNTSNNLNTLPDDFIAPACHEKVSFLYRDDYLLVIDKPSGLLSLSGKNPANKDSVHYRLTQDYPSASMVHRLDFGTSGVMVVALNKTVNAHLTKQFQARSIVKKYTATLLGHVTQDEDVIDSPLAKAEFPYQKACRKTGKPAQSRYQVLERLTDPISKIKTTRVLFTPITGRTHQLRVHSLEIGHPIIGCDLYGATIDGVDSRALARRLLLHACSLIFEHPITAEKLHIESQQLNLGLSDASHCKRKI